MTVVELRSYQGKAVAETLAYLQRGAPGVMLESPVGSGKTTMGMEIVSRMVAAGKSCGWFTHRVELADQASERAALYGVPHGRIMPGQGLTHSPFHIASVDTVTSRMAALRPWLEGLDFAVFDECVPAGTMVGNAPIEDIDIGDEVPSFDETSGHVCCRVVTHVFRRLTSVVVRITTDSGLSVVCTPNHPIFTEEGFTHAGEIAEGCLVKIHPMCGMRKERDHCEKIDVGPMEEDGPGLLQSDLLNGISEASLVGDNGQNQSSSCLCQDDRKKSDEKPDCSGKSVRNPSPYRAQTEDTRWKWEGNAGTSSEITSCPGAGLESRVYCADRNKGERTSQPLQDQSCQSIDDGGGRSGWRKPQCDSGEGGGWQEGAFLDVARVARVEVFKQGCDVEFEQMCPGGIVFNLEVDGTSTYFANGIAVHNCHHIASASWTRIADAMTRAQNVGLTATPYRLDGKGLGEGGHFSATVRAPGIQELTEAGYLAPAIVYAPKTDLDLSRVTMRGGDYAMGEMAAAVGAANIPIIGRRWYARHAPGQPAVVFCPTVELAEKSAAAYLEAGWLATSVDGTMSATERARAINGLADGSVQVLTSCALIGEGLDIPAISVAILERPTASTALFVQQVGRALRPHADKTHATILDLVGNSARHGMYDAERPWDIKGGLKGQERAVAGTWRCRACARVHSLPVLGGRMVCGCGNTQTVRGFNPPAIESHPPIAGIPADLLLSMKWKDAVAAMKSYGDLVAFGRLYHLAHPDKMQHPEAWARMTMELRDKYRAQFRRRA